MNLNDQIAIADKFNTATAAIPLKDQSEQLRVALDWAKRLESQPPPEPIKTLKPIIPVAN